MHDALTTALLALAAVTAPMPHPVPEADAIRAPAADAWIGPDKAQHFWVSYAAAAFVFAAAVAGDADRDLALGVAAGSAFALGLAKEFDDVRRGRIFSVRDLVADALGIGAAYFLLREVR